MGKHSDLAANETGPGSRGSANRREVLERRAFSNPGRQKQVLASPLTGLGRPSFRSVPKRRRLFSLVVERTQVAEGVHRGLALHPVGPFDERVNRE